MLMMVYSCGRKFMCRRGDRGPCHRNEVFVPQQNTSHNAIISASSCSNFNAWNGCFPADKFPDVQYTFIQPYLEMDYIDHIWVPPLFDYR